VAFLDGLAPDPPDPKEDDPPPFEPFPPEELEEGDN
jgi:hypothetical protein